MRGLLEEIKKNNRLPTHFPFIVLDAEIIRGRIFLEQIRLH